MSKEPPHPERSAWPGVLLALVGLNLLLTVSFSSAAPWVRPVAAISPDLLLLAAAGALLGGRRPRRWVRFLVAPILLVAASVRIAGLIALELLGRPLDPAGDLPHLGNVAEMLATVSPVLAPAVLIPLGGLLLGGLLYSSSARWASSRRREPAWTGGAAPDSAPPRSSCSPSRGSPRPVVPPCSPPGTSRRPPPPTRSPPSPTRRSPALPTWAAPTST